MKFSDIVLVTGATLRLSRFVAEDTLGDWWIVRPAKDWAVRHEGGEQEIHEMRSADGSVHRTSTDLGTLDPERGWRSKLVSGLECPFCAGFWIGAGALGFYFVARDDPRILQFWRVGAGILGLNYVTGHISSRLD